MNGEGFAYFRWTLLRQYSRGPTTWFGRGIGWADVMIEDFYPREYLEGLGRAGETLRRLRSAD